MTEETYKDAGILRSNIHDTCELGTKYNDLKQVRDQLKLAFEELERKNKRLEDEKTALGESAKKALEAKDTEYSSALKEAREKTQKAQQQLNEHKELLADNQRYQKENDRLRQEQKVMSQKKRSEINNVDNLTSVCRVKL